LLHAFSPAVLLLTRYGGSHCQLTVLVKTQSSDQSRKQCRYTRALGGVGFGKLMEQSWLFCC